ncbi:MAG TPA: AAA domain-containing protein [Syntrophorhabdaceae bacterium]|nr:AAA domain-containing protein [Syntrophorhabdaceae bacterium]
MHHIFLIAGIAIGGAAVAWIYNSKTENEKKKQDELTAKIESVREMTGDLSKKYELELSEYIREKCTIIRNELIKAVRYFTKEKETVGKDLENLKKAINRELQKPDISPYLYNGLKRELVYIEDAINRLNAYMRYVAWFEAKVELLFKNCRYDELKNFDPPEPLLPDDWLYLGKLILLDNQQELGKKNRYGQKLYLNSRINSRKIHGTDRIDFEVEKRLFESYKTDIPILIEYEKTWFNEPETDESTKIDHPRVFKGSVLKGELYVDHILKDMPFVVKPQRERIDRSENYYFYKNVIPCKMRSRDKRYPLKRYYDDDEITVYAIEHDILLKKLIVSERPPQEDSVSAYPVYISYSRDELVEGLDDALAESQYKLSVSDYDPLNQTLTFRAGERSLVCSIRENYLSLQELRKGLVPDSVAIELPFSFEIAPENLIKENVSFLRDSKNAIVQMLSFVDKEIEYHKHISSDSAKDDYDFFAKWLRIVEHLITKEEIAFDEVQYSELLREDIKSDSSPRLLTITVNPRHDNIKKLTEIAEKIKLIQEQSRKLKYEKFTVALEIRNSPRERFFRCPIGILYDDIDLIKKRIVVQLDIDLPDWIEYEQNKKLFIGQYRNPSALERQKRALINFQKGEMVNPELKRMLISPQLIRKTVNPYEEEAFDRSIKWKNTELTDNQKEIIKNALLEQNLFIIQGPPGTGKTTIIKEIVYQYLKDNPKRKCLIVSQQNTAVDNALKRIYKENKDEWFDYGSKNIVRVAVDTGKVDDAIQPFTIDNWFNDYKRRLCEAYQKTLARDVRLQKLMQDWYRLVDKENISLIDREVADVLLSSHQIVGATCVGFANKRLGIDRAEFDLAIIDEAARATPPELLIPILRAKKVILIGDQYQLPPAFGSSIIDDLKDLDFATLDFLEKSFFERLFDSAPDTNKAMLLEQFRMPKEVGTMISKIFYDGNLINGIEKSTEGFVSPKTTQWIDVKGQNKIEGTSRYNQKETEAVKKLITEIANSLPKGLQKDVAVINPYTAQKKMINKTIANLRHHQLITKGLHIKCDTVDNFQGQEADIVVYSCVRTEGNLSFLIDRKRLNVALSRAKENLYIVGHRDFLYNAEVDGKENLFKSIIDYIDSLS